MQCLIEPQLKPHAVPDSRLSFLAELLDFPEA